MHFAPMGNHKYLVLQALVLLHIPALVALTAICPGQVGSIIHACAARQLAGLRCRIPISARRTEIGFTDLSDKKKLALPGNRSFFRLAPGGNFSS